MFMFQTVIIGAIAILATGLVSFMIGHIIHRATIGNSETIASKIATGILFLIILGVAFSLCAMIGMFVRLMFGYV